MSGRKKRPVKLEAKIEPRLSPFGENLVLETRLRRGVAEFTGMMLLDLGREAERTEGLGPPRESRVLAWQTWNELNLDHGLARVWRFLDDKEDGILKGRSPQDLEAELLERLGPEEWAETKRRFVLAHREVDRADAKRLTSEGLAALREELEKKVRTFEDIPSWEMLLTAIWAEHFVERLEIGWLAAMAGHAFYVEGNDYAFGYLSALIDQRLKNEDLYLRGLVNKKSTDAGGDKRAADAEANKTRVLAEMARLRAKGKTVRQAAELAYTKAKIGSSVSSNRQHWYREKKRPPKK